MQTYFFIRVVISQFWLFDRIARYVFLLQDTNWKKNYGEKKLIVKLKSHYCLFYFFSVAGFHMFELLSTST